MASAEAKWGCEDSAQVGTIIPDNQIWTTPDNQ